MCCFGNMWCSVDEESVLSEKQGFICRKCFRAFESFKAAKKKLLLSANTALQFVLFPLHQLSVMAQVVIEGEGCHL